MSSIKILHSKILKLYHAHIFMALKIKRLPKCIIKYFIQNFMDFHYENLELKRVSGRGSLRGENWCQTNFYKFGSYHIGKVGYLERYNIEEKHLILDIDKCYIDEKFSASYDLWLYKYPTNSKYDDDYILTLATILKKIYKCGLLYIENFLIIPLFGEHLIDIMKKYTNTLVEVVEATCELIKIENKKKGLTEKIKLI